MYSSYPIQEPFNQGRLKVSDLHEIYYEESGNKNGPAIVFVHGGPGGGADPDSRRFFDPSHYRIILFDQRGCGRSTPHAELKDNTTWDLVSDMEVIREKLQIDKWVVFGGSWGSTLSLAYAVTHPDRVKGLVLRGIFLCRKQEINWFYQEGASRIYPDAWDIYRDHIPANERHDFVSAYHQRLTSEDKNTRMEAARRWSVWEGSTSRLIPDNKMMDRYGQDEFAIAFARIECHYFTNNAFFKTDNYLIEQCHKIQHVPTEIIHGRYDVVCPVENAWDLKRALPKANLQIIADAGHAAKEPGIESALIAATERMKSL